MKIPERKYRGRTVTFVIAGAASTFGITAVSAIPRQQKLAAPTASVRSTAGR
jgi:hypothetical protein